ncbi:DUF190 domain-containing protein [Caenispirillum bisanense]|uniref:Nitrogen regulatory protein P-II n=1 Tax=Caenispirillum bisanense TaxID=414052 RepID=A0A286GN10_9PROT|nr:DUF190 domain-containing protein [Caenispirillum bisanense]SOD96469.1 nitrogen regulatory protein P-II family [Caenispirillum bisanense]
MTAAPRPHHPRRKIEILTPMPLLGRVVALLKQHGAPGHTVLPALSGRGGEGTWDRGHVSDAETCVLVVAVMAAERADPLFDALAPLLADAGVAWMSDVEVLRGEKY